MPRPQPTPSDIPRVAIYARCSGQQQADRDLSIPAQLDACRNTASARGWEIVHEYVDAAETARTDDRPQFQDMLHAARSKSHPFDYILVWKFSRFARNREVSVLWKRQLERHDVRVVSLNEPVDDSPSGRMLEGILEVVDEFYSANLAQDIQRGMRKNASMGFRNGGPAPYGYTAVRTGTSEHAPRMRLVPDPAAAPLIQRMFDMILEGYGLTAIASTLDDEGIRTHRGKRWSKTTVMAVIKNEVYAGHTIYGRSSAVGTKRQRSESSVRIENTHEALVTQHRFDEVQHMLRTRARVSSTSKNRLASDYLMSGILHCGLCGSIMVGHPAKGGKFEYYGCSRKLKTGASACDSKLVNAKRAEAAFVDAIETHIFAPEPLSKLLHEQTQIDAEALAASKAALEATRTELSEHTNRLERLYDALETGTLDVTVLAPRLREQKTKVDALRATLEQQQLNLRATQADPTPDELAAHSTTLTTELREGHVSRRRHLLDTFVDRIVAHGQSLTIHYSPPPFPNSILDGLRAATAELRGNSNPKTTEGPLLPGTPRGSRVLSRARSGGADCTPDKTVDLYAEVPPHRPDRQAPTPEAVPEGLRAETWRRWLDEGRYTSASELSTAMGRSRNYVSTVLYRAQRGR